MERRNITNTLASCRIRGEEKEPRFIEGYAAVFYRENDPGTEYRLWNDFVERIMPGTFDRALKANQDVRALFNHDSDNLLGRSSNDTVKLSADKTGLKFSIPIDENDADHARVVAKIKRGDLSGSSFAFSNAAADWSDVRDGEELVTIRAITDLDLIDVGPVTFPAYEATEAGLRTCVETSEQLSEARSLLTAHRKALDEHRSNQAIQKSLAIETRWAELND